MRLLGLELSSGTTSIAICDDQELLAKLSHSCKNKDSSVVLQMIKKLLDDLKLTLNDIEAFAVSIGPGSFTGLRVALCYVKGFCMILNKPVIPVDSLDIYAINFRENADRVAVIMDAKKRGVYARTYSFKGNKIDSKSALYTGSIEGFLKNVDGSCLFCGDAAEKHAKDIKKVFDNDFRIKKSAASVFDAENLLILARESFDKNNTLDFHRLVPFYQSESEAEIQWKNNFN